MVVKIITDTKLESQTLQINDLKPVISKHKEVKKKNLYQKYQR